MTLEDDRKKKENAGVGGSLRQLLVDAQKQGRLTCGIYDSGTLLAKSADSIMLCVLPADTSTDVSLHIHATLIEAFCCENDIRVVKVDAVDKVQMLLEANAADCDFLSRWSSADYNCLLVEYPQSSCSPDEEMVLDFYKRSCNLVPLPTVQLDV